MKRTCELCTSMVARIHCESDQASLCWNCDAMVHSANFLVARHSRNLLCRVCQRPTPWSASGSNMEPTFTVCGQCVDRRIRDESGEEDEDEAADGVETMEIGENQVVPWSSPPPESESSWSGEEPARSGEVVVSRKRCRLDNDQPSDEDDGLSAHTSIHTPPLVLAAAVASAADSISGRTSTPPRNIRSMDQTV